MAFGVVAQLAEVGEHERARGEREHGGERDRRRVRPKRAAAARTSSTQPTPASTHTSAAGSAT